MTDSAVSRRIFSRPWLLRGLLILAALCLGSCTMVPELGALMDRSGNNGRKIVVCLKSQRTELFHYGKLASAPISSGREGKGTPVGKFRVIQKSPNHRSSLYGNYVRNEKVVKENIDNRKEPRPAGSQFQGVPMPYFIRFSGAYGLHAGNLPGYPASSGCVRLPQRHAKRFFDAVKIGTPVVVQR